MSEFALLRVQRFRTIAGAATCASGPTPADSCRFYAVAGAYGKYDVCGAMKGALISRADSDIGPRMGYMEPAKGCPVWESMVGGGQ